MSRPSPLFMRTILIVLCFILTCVLGNRIYTRKDMTQSAQHSLTPQSVETIALLSDPVDVEVFINPSDPNKEAVAQLFTQYQQHKNNINVAYTDPALDPHRMRKLDVAAGGEIFINYQNRTQRLSHATEQSLTMALQRLSRKDTRQVLFTTGHGERSIESKSNADIGLFAQQLKATGINTGTINLSERSSLDPDIGTLVIAGPMQRFLPNEVLLLLDFISNGGNLVWLTEPFTDDGLDSLAIELGITRLPGVVIDMAAQQLEVERPDFAIANLYSQHQATVDFSAVTLYPQASGLQVNTDREWQAAALVQTGEQAWTETGAITGKVAFGDDEREISGPFPLILALERDKAGRKQRVIVSGDGDFLADAWLANGGNRDLGNRLFNWSVDEAILIGAAAPQKSDAKLELSNAQQILLAGVAFLLLPGFLLSTATGVWYQRRHG